eukprot:426610-Prymnesium_polylepis.1
MAGVVGYAQGDPAQALPRDAQGRQLPEGRPALARRAAEQGARPTAQRAGSRGERRAALRGVLGVSGSAQPGCGALKRWRAEGCAQPRAAPLHASAPRAPVPPRSNVRPCPATATAQEERADLR